MVNLFNAGRTNVIAPQPVDRRLADALIIQALKPQNRPIRSAGEGAANMATRLVNAYMGKHLMDKEAERSQTASDTMAQALQASKPWRTPDAVEAGPGPNQPALKPGDAFPGTGGPDAMIAALSKNRDTAPLAFKMAIERQVKADELAAALQKMREGENIYMQGRGNPRYQGDVAAARREPIPDAATRAEAIARAQREPINDAAARAGAVANAKLPAAKDLATFTAQEKAKYGITGKNVPSPVATATWLATHTAALEGRAPTDADYVNSFREIQQAKTSPIAKAQLIVNTFNALKRADVANFTNTPTDKLEKQANDIVERAIRGQDQQASDSKPPSRPGEAEAGAVKQGKGTKDAPFRPSTQADLDALKPGEYAINPQTGQLFRKK